MTRFFIYCFSAFFLLYTSTTIAQSVKHITLSYNESDFIYSYDSGGNLNISSNTVSFVLGEDSLAPALPYFPVYVLINQELEYDYMSVTNSDSIVFSNVDLAANPPIISTKFNAPKATLRANNYNGQIYPSNNIEYSGTQVIAGYKVLSFLVTPYIYDATNKQLRFIKTFDINIHFVTPTSPNIIPMGKGEVMKDFVSNIIINGDELDSLYNPSPHGMLVPPVNRSNDYKYVIITDSSLVKAYQPLVAWKTQKGVKAKIVTTQEIHSHYNEATPQLNIKRALKDMYDDGLEYALLGGGVELIPVQMCHPARFTIDTNSIPSDMFYACFDNSFDWNANNNNVCGEVNDNVDFGPEIIVTRIPLSDFADVNVIVKRIINYERDMDIEPLAWKDRILMCGNAISDKDTCDAQRYSEKMYNEGISRFKYYSRFRFYNSYTDYPQGSSYPLNGDNLQTEIEKGYAFWDYAGHGWIHAWGQLEDSTLYDYHHAEDLINKTFTVITTICCYSNAFDKNASDGYDDRHKMCTGLLRNPNSGIVAYYGSSREGWSPTSFAYNTSFYKHLFNGNSSNFGKVAMLSKSDYSSNAYNSDIHRFLQYAINPVGDPEMPMRTSIPHKFDHLSITANESIYINTGVDNCTICAMSISDGGESFYEVRKGVRTTSFELVSDSMSICVSKDNYIPTIYTIVRGGNIYIQNEELTKNNDIQGSYIRIGSNVTTDKDEGPVTIENGSTVIKSTNGVTITQDFEVKEGAGFEIRVVN